MPKREPMRLKMKTAGKLTYKDQRELDGMEAAIEAAESKKSELEKQAEAAASNASELGRLADELERASAEVNKLYARWEELQAASRTP